MGKRGNLDSLEASEASLGELESESERCVASRLDDSLSVEEGCTGVVLRAGGATERRWPRSSTVKRGRGGIDCVASNEMHIDNLYFW